MTQSWFLMGSRGVFLPLFAVTNLGGSSFLLFGIVPTRVSRFFSSFLPSAKLVKKLSHVMFLPLSLKGSARGIATLQPRLLFCGAFSL